MVHGQEPGGAPKKLVGGYAPNGETEKGWAHYEFGWIGGEETGHPGSCGACIAHFKKRTGPNNLFDQVAKAAGLKNPSRPLKVIQTQGPPCHECPKSALYRNPSNRGLHPENELPVKIYYLSRRPERVGTFEGAYIVYTTTPSNILRVMSAYKSHLPNSIARQNCLELVTAIDQVATEVQSEREERVRDRQRKNSKVKD